MSDKSFDVVIYGATGFTGKLVVEYMQEKYGNDESVSWAIAGRSKEKLIAVSEDLKLGPNVPHLLVDSNDTDSIVSMVQQAQCVLTTVGPYQLYGANILQQCVIHGVDYVDLCGEPGWMHEMITEHAEQAKETGARIVFSCGFDSIPFDLGVYFLQKEVIARHGQPASNVRGRVRAMNGEFSGGTAASLGATMASLKEKPELFEILVNPFALSNGFIGPEQAQDSKPIYDDKLETWVAPFFMAPINTKNVHRSNALMDHLYGEDFCYNEMWIQGPGEEGKAAAEFVGSMNPLADAPAPGEGPSKESRENGNYDVLFCADLSDGSSLHASVSGDMDPGYGSTSKMIAESALCLVDDCSELSGGIYTPAPAMGEKLIVRLQASAGLTFKIED
ncbi:saccharopine dehydrogenase NADP-binding domain-containing protein [Gammaproteobacteria bacterium]|nr:saccharopine dehydrogenase NADP-binding domain-containing protein [Gammaproteobacteria bacterium]MDC0913890.1 saccharopine dehydrogenase NADP-binding domain-containing protein [Gammaproteobacteria bacterium]MDC1110045.1 saccharopine dehydrogenase NADP-binding domain-containing protein [Gammaproteobacteria bacterium]MDC1132224.1 saccharopine dehydrogenase NADP-binding domain-containing protein [Gammaproteobacteria bacterium]